jgi:hypothetical protein
MQVFKKTDAQGRPITYKSRATSFVKAKHEALQVPR